MAASALGSKASFFWDILFGKQLRDSPLPAVVGLHCVDERGSWHTLAHAKWLARMGCWRVWFWGFALRQTVCHLETSPGTWWTPSWGCDVIVETEQGNMTSQGSWRARAHDAWTCIWFMTHNAVVRSETTGGHLGLPLLHLSKASYWHCTFSTMLLYSEQQLGECLALATQILHEEQIERVLRRWHTDIT